MTKASPARAEKKAAQTQAKKDPREAAKAAVAKKQAEAEANKPAPQLTGPQAAYLWHVLRKNALPTTGDDRDMLASCEKTLAEIGIAAGILTRDPRQQAPQ